MNCVDVTGYITATLKAGNDYLRNLPPGSQNWTALQALQALQTSYRGLTEWRGVVTEKNCERVQRLYEIGHERAVTARKAIGMALDDPAAGATLAGEKVKE